MAGNNIFENLITSVDNKILRARINSAMDLLKNSSAQELNEKINKLDKSKLNEQLNNIDMNKIKQSGIDVGELKQNITASDIAKVKQAAGQENADLVNKVLNLYDRL